MKHFLSEYPELIKEWHPTKNGELKPEKVTHAFTRCISFLSSLEIFFI